MRHNRAARRRAARRAPRTGRPRAGFRGPQGRARTVARAGALVLGAALVILAIAVLATPLRGGNPGRAARGLVFVVAFGVLLCWWGLSGRGL